MISAGAQQLKLDDDEVFLEMKRNEKIQRLVRSPYEILDFTRAHLLLLVFFPV